MAGVVLFPKVCFASGVIGRFVGGLPILYYVLEVCYSVRFLLLELADKICGSSFRLCFTPAFDS